MTQAVATADEHKNAMAEARMKDILRQRIAGTAHPHSPTSIISDPEHREAVRLWEELKKNDDERKGREAERQDRVLLEARRLDIEQERLQIEKANVVVRLLEVAVQGGVSGDRLLEAVHDITGRLLPMAEAAGLPTALLEVKKENG